MSDTPRTDDEAEYWLDPAMSGEYQIVPAEFARQLERELADSRAWSSKLADVADDLRAELAETAKDYRCLAELLGGHDATECRVNLVKLKADLAAERALADRLAEQVRELRYYDGKSPSANKRSDEAIAAWKEARRE